MKIRTVLLLAVAMCGATPAIAHQAKPVHGSDIEMTSAQADEIALGMLKLGKEYPQIIVNSARFDQECKKANLHTGMCMVYDRVTKVVFAPK